MPIESITRTVTANNNYRIAGATNSAGSWNTFISYSSDTKRGFSNNIMQALAVNSYGEKINTLKADYTVRGGARINVYLITQQLVPPNEVATNYKKKITVDVPSGQTVAHTVTFDDVDATAEYGSIFIIFESVSGASDISFGNIVISGEANTSPPDITLVSPINAEITYGQQITFVVSATPKLYSTVYWVYFEYSYDNEQWTLIGSGSNQSILFNTVFSPGTLYWRAKAKSYYSNYSEYATGSCQILETLPISNAASPKNNYEEKGNQIKFTWLSSNRNGTITGAELEYDLGDGEGWRSLGTVTGNIAEYIVPANTFPACNSITWRVRSKNGDNKYGNWSSASFATIDALIIASPLSPINGAARDETMDIGFSWNTLSPLGSQPTGADLQWRLSQGNWQTLGFVEGAEKSFTVPANTFPGSMIYWRVRAYNQEGAIGDWSSEANFSTVDAPSVSTPTAPIGTIEDTDDDLLFRWSTNSSSGTPPTHADLHYSYDGNEWLELGQTDGTQYLIVAGGTIHAGTVQWRVRSYNRNGTAGEWSNPVAFVAHAAPRILDITADGKPFTTITWQATDQQTYEIVIDNQVTYGSFFGEEKSFQLPDYLEDGTHTVKIRVQNAMSMWSKWSELSFSVLNDPGEEIQLTGDFDVDAELYWADESDYADYLVYRDGILIAETPHRFFSDRVVLGEHAYYVVNRFADGNYSKSNKVECTLNTDTPLVAFLSGGEWMPLEKSENPQQSQRFTRTRVVAYHHFIGDKNPTPEVGDEEDLVAEYDAAWFYTEEGSKKLKSMVGQALIIKSCGEEVVIGVLEGYSKVNRKHFRGFAFNLKQMEWKDYICVE